jgi:hypothetical protein
VNAPGRYAQAVVQPDSAMPVASTALVPVSVDRAPRPVVQEKPVNAHWFFYGIGYSGLALLWAAMLLDVFVGPGVAGLYVFAWMGIVLGGFGIFIHTVYKPNERKVRRLLLAIGSLVLTGLATAPVEHITREMYATAAVGRLQPLAEALAKDARIQEIGAGGGRVTLNGYYGPEQGYGRIDREDAVLDDVLARDGISRGEHQAYQKQLRRAGVDRAQRTASTVAFTSVGFSRPWLVYVMPGHALPPGHALLDDEGTYHSQPLGGPWYMVLSGRH